MFTIKKITQYTVQIHLQKTYDKLWLKLENHS